MLRIPGTEKRTDLPTEAVQNLFAIRTSLVTRIGRDQRVYFGDAMGSISLGKDMILAMENGWRKGRDQKHEQEHEQDDWTELKSVTVYVSTRTDGNGTGWRERVVGVTRGRLTT